MQAGKKTAASVNETIADIGASARSGMEKTKPTLQDKVEKMTARDPLEKEIVEAKREEKIAQAELDKQEAFAHNTAAKEAALAEGVASHPTGQGDRRFANHSSTVLHGHGSP